MKKTQIVGQMSFFGDDNIYVPPKLTKNSSPPTTSLSTTKESIAIKKQNNGTKISNERLQELFEMAIQMVKDVEIELEPINDKVLINTRKSSDWGYCLYRRDKNYIYVCQNLLYVSEHDIMTTLLHEVLHSTPGCHNHGSLWKARADKVNKKYGYNIKRITSQVEKGLNVEELNLHKYMVKCDKCGMVVGRNRMSNLIKDTSRFKCANCGGKFNRIK